MFTKLWKAISPPIDAAMIVPAVSFAFPAIETHSIAISISSMITTIPVSYTHLDVYKRQPIVVCLLYYSISF